LNDDLKHPTAREIEKLIEAAKGSRFEARDRCLLLMMFRHGLRVSEACGLEMSRVDIESRVLHVARVKKGFPPRTR
jgi:type 1 fimbriae regulatory protein FimB